MKEVKAWETNDGELFKREEDARQHEENLNIEEIRAIEWKFLQKILEKKLGVDVYQYSNGWECDLSPNGICVYESDAIQKHGEESCYYCGNPEERK